MLSGCSQPGSEDATYDIVLAGGRVMDPESGLDAIQNVGVRDGLIAAVTENALDGTRIIDASGLVVAPGFIDLHVHGQTDYSFTFMIRDGVTSASSSRWAPERSKVGTASVKAGNAPIMA